MILGILSYDYDHTIIRNFLQSGEKQRYQKDMPPSIVQISKLMIQRIKKSDVRR